MHNLKPRCHTDPCWKGSRAPALAGAFHSCPKLFTLPILREVNCARTTWTYTNATLSKVSRYCLCIHPVVCNLLYSSYPDPWYLWASHFCRKHCCRPMIRVLLWRFCDSAAGGKAASTWTLEVHG